MKTVFSNDMLAHVWAQLKQPHGRSSSMRFDGSTAYSYAEPVAHIVETPTGIRVALFTSRTWSVTTSKHVSMYRRACGPEMRQFTVPDMLLGRYHVSASEFNDAHHTNVEQFRTDYRAMLTQLMRAPSHSWRVRNFEPDGQSENYQTAAHRDLCELSRTLEDYQQSFGLEVTPLPWQVDADAAIARRDRLANDPKAIARRAAQEAAEKARAEKRALAEFERTEKARAAFRAGEPRTWETRCADEQGRAYLRLSSDGATVETSQGADAPLSDVSRVLALYSRIWWDGQPAWKVPAEWLKDARLGSFRLDSIDADGTARAGCHRFSATEIKRFKTFLWSRGK